MSLSNIVIILIAGFGIIYLIRSKSGRYKKPKHVAVIDPEAQKAYIGGKENVKQVLTMEEKINLSWQFLINLKQVIMSKFSASDQETLNNAADILIQNGMQYQHDIEQEVKVTLELSRAESVSKSRRNEQSVSL